jgi:predicted MFS family arabinose efflux permease
LLIGAGGAIILVNAVSFYGDMSSLWFLRPIAGAAAGIAVGVANAIIARSIDPDRLYGLSSTLGTAMSAFALLLTPYFTAWLGYSGVFLLLGVSAVMLTPIALLLPTHVDLLPPQAKLASPNFLSTSGLFVVATAVLLNLGDGSLYSFSELIGERSGLDKTEIGEVLAIAGLFGVLGALLAATLGSRLGRLAPFAVAVTLKAVGSLVVTTMISPSAFVAMQFLLTCTFYFSIVFLLGLSASIDPRGGLPAMTGGFILLGGSVGPVFGGAVVEHFGYPWFGIGVALCLAAAFACFVIADRLNRAVLVEKI